MKIRLTLLLAVVSLAIPSPLLACMCVAPRTEQEAIEQSAAFFAGRVPRTRVVHDAPGGPDLEATFRVRRWWKGEGGRTVTVRTSHSSCGVPLRAGRSYRVFAERFRGHLFTGSCSAPSSTRPPVAVRPAGRVGRGCAG